MLVLMGDIPDPSFLQRDCFGVSQINKYMQNVIHSSSKCYLIVAWKDASELRFFFVMHPQTSVGMHSVPKLVQVLLK